jgi:putative NADH-flavin reductase
MLKLCVEGKLCVAGAAGRMGNAIIAEAVAKGHQILTLARPCENSG